MSYRNLDAIMYVTEPPEIEYRHGLFFLRQRFSETFTIERVMSPHVFMLGLRLAAEAAHKHKFGGAEIIRFPAEEDSPAQHSG